MFNSKPKPSCSAFAALVLVMSTAVFANGDEHTIRLDQDVSPADTITINVPIGNVVILGIAGNQFSAETRASCKKAGQESCHQLLKEMTWNKKIANLSEFSLLPSSATDFDSVTLNTTIKVPTDKKLVVNVDAGDLRINQTSACLTANLKAGEINIETQEAFLSSANLTAKVGDVSITTSKGEKISGTRQALIGAKLQWNKGPNGCRLNATVMAGAVGLTLK